MDIKRESRSRMTASEERAAPFVGHPSHEIPISTIGLFVADPVSRSLVESLLREMGHRILSSLPSMAECEGVDLFIVDQQFAPHIGSQFHSVRRDRAFAGI